MNQTWQSHRKKNWQWRIIIWSSLFLIFGKNFGHWVYHALAMDQAYTTSTTLANKAGLAIPRVDSLETYDPKSGVPVMTQLIIDVKNDTPNAYSIEVKSQSTHVNFIGHVFEIGDTKRFVIKPNLNATDSNLGTGDIYFSSAPMAGNTNTTCQEVHTLNFNLKDANRIKQPVTIPLSSIASKLNCQNNSEDKPSTIN